MATHNDFGKQGEQLAEQFLINKGYSIIARNYHFGKGEIDLITTHQDMLVFIEVRARKDEEIIRVTDTIRKKKKRLLLKTANHFVLGFCSNMILIAIVNGTERNIPTVPKTKPQKISATKTTKVESPRPFPIIFGSTRFPTTMFTLTKMIIVQNAPPAPN